MAAGVLRTSFAFSGAPVGPSREQIVVLALERGRPRLLEIVVDRGRSKRSRTAVGWRSPIWCFRRAMRTASPYPRSEVRPSREHVVALPLERSRPRLLEIVVDRGSVEAFANGGRIAFTDLKFPPRDADRVAVFAQRGRATFSGLTVAQLRAGDDTTDDSAPR